MTTGNMTTELFPPDAVFLIHYLQKNVDRASTWRSTARTLGISEEECKRARGLRESRGLDAVLPYGFGRDAYLLSFEAVLDKYANKFNALIDLDRFFKERDLEFDGCSEVLKEVAFAESDEISTERVDAWMKRFELGLARAYRNEAKPDASKR